MEKSDLTTPCQTTYSVVLPGILAGCSLPGNGSATELVTDCAWLKEVMHVRGIISLNERPPSTEVLATFGIQHLELDVKDYRPPSCEQFARATQFTRSILDESGLSETGACVAVHCNAGQGRTGTLLAALLVSLTGSSAREAINLVRSMRKGSVQTFKQEDGILLWEQYLSKHCDEAVEYRL